MKKFLTILVISTILISCGGGGGDDPPPPPPPANKAPSTPTQSSPTNNLLCIDNVVQFQWNASTDPEGDTISYELQIATDNQFSQNFQTITSSSTSTSVSLEKGIAYYWRIKAKDSKNSSSSYSSTFSFLESIVGTLEFGALQRKTFPAVKFSSTFKEVNCFIFLLN